MAAKQITDAMSVTDIRANFSAVVNEVYREGNRVVIEKDGLPVAAIVSRSDLQYLQNRDAERAAAWQKLEELRLSIGDAFAGISEEDLLQQAVADVREVREELAREFPERYGRPRHERAAS